MENCHLSVQNDGEPVDAVDVETTWESLVSRPGAQLIDVRTRAEWTYVGIPDLGAIGKRAASSNGRPFLIRPWIQILLAVGIAALVSIVLFVIYRVAVMQPIWN